MATKTISRFFLLAIIFLFILVSNSFASSTWLASIPGATDDVPTRIAIDKEGNLYVTQPRTKNNLLVYNRHGSLIRTLYGLNGPIGVAIDSNSRIYIGNDTTGSVDVYNADFSFSHKLGKGKGEFQTPNSIAISSSGLIYITDTKAHIVKVYNPDGTLAFAFGGWGQGNGKFNFPLGLAIDANKAEVYVTDLGIFIDPVNGATSGARVQVFDLNGGYKRSFGQYGTGEGKLIRPLGIAIDADSKVYITDGYQAVVHVFDENGASLETIYNTSHPMKTPIGIAIGKDKRIFIASSNTPSIEIYGLAGYTTMTTTPSSLTYEAEEGGAAPLLQGITISNGGEGILNWTAASNSDWITLSQTTGSTAPQTSTAISVGIKMAGLAAGTYIGSVKVVAESGATDIITVSLNVAPPPMILSIKPSALSFKAQQEGPNPAAQKIIIENLGKGEMSWAGATDQAWLSLDTTSGIAPSTVSVNVNSSSLNAGTYTGSITINAPGAQESPAAVKVTLKVIYAGTVKVVTNLEQAGFDITGPASYSGTGTEWSDHEAAPGDYTISFKHVSGYLKPQTRTFQVQTGKEVIINGEYRTKPVATHIVAGSGGNGNSVVILPLDNTAPTSFTPFTSKSGVRVAAGDIDASGLEKVIVTDRTRTMKVYTPGGLALASFALPTSYSNIEIAVGDIDNDGRADIIAGAVNSYYADRIQREIKLFSYNNGNLEEKDTLYTENKSGEFTITLGDINGDGALEIIIVDRENIRAFGIDLTPASSKLTQIWSVNQTPLSAATPQVSAGDINDDGAAEIALSIETYGSNQDIIKILKGTGEDYEVTTGNKLVIDAFGDLGYKKPSTVAFGDIDGDGADEIVTGAGRDKRNEPLIRIFESNGTFTGTAIKAMEGNFGVNVGLGRFR